MIIDISVITSNFSVFIKGLVATLELTLTAFPLAFIVGLMATLGRLKGPSIIRAPIIAYVEFFRTTPPLVQLLWMFFALPIIVGLRITPITAAIIGLVLNGAAFLAEIFRAGIQSVEIGQIEAAQVLGLSGKQTMAHIVLPQAIRTVLPAIGNIAVGMFVQTSLVSVLAVSELSYWGSVVAAMTSRPLEVFSFVAVIYFVMAYPASLLIRIFERRGKKEVARGYR